MQLCYEKGGCDLLLLKGREAVGFICKNQITSQILVVERIQLDIVLV